MLVPAVVRQPISAPNLPPSSGRRVFPTLFVEICRRHVYIIFLSIAVIPYHNLSNVTEPGANAVEAAQTLQYYVNEKCEQIAPFRVVSAGPPC